MNRLKWVRSGEKCHEVKRSGENEAKNPISFPYMDRKAGEADVYRQIRAFHRCEESTDCSRKVPGRTGQLFCDYTGTGRLSLHFASEV